MRFFLAILASLALSSCALAQRGTLRSERVIITNQNTPVYPPDDLIIRNDSLDNRIQMGINAATDQAIVSLYNENDNLVIELSAAESTSMFRLLADSPNANIITAGRSTGGTALDIGYLDVRGEDRASGLDAYTVIAGGDVDTNTILVRTTNASAGYVQWDDTGGGGGLVSLFGYNGAGTSYSLYWPQAAPSASSCSGTCVIEIDDTTGQMSFAASGGGGGGSHPVVDTTSLVEGSADATKELRLEVDGLTASTTRVWTAQDTDLLVAGIDVAQTWTATQTMRDINPSLDSTYNIGNLSARYGGIYSDVAHTELVAFVYQGSGSTNYSMGVSNPGADLRVFNNSGTTLMLWDSTRILSYEDFRPVSASSLNLGDAILPWANIYGDSYVVNTEVLPDASAGANIGSASLRFLGHFDDISMYNNPVISTDADNSGTLGSSGTIWGGVFTGSVSVGKSASISGLFDIYNSSTAGAASLRTNNISGAVDFETQDHIYPSASNTLDLGASSRRWRKVWTTDLDVSGTCTGCGGGSSLPVVDTTSIVEGSADGTKELRFEVDGFTTGTTRILTPQNSNYTIAGTNISNTFTATQTLRTISFGANNTYTLGTGSLRPSTIYGYTVVLGSSGVTAGQLQLLNTSAIGGTISVNSGADVTIDTDFVPNVTGTHDLGTVSLKWNDLHANIVRASTGYIAPSGSGGATSTLTCGAGQAVKNITVSGGIVTSVSCGTP